MTKRMIEKTFLKKVRRLPKDIGAAVRTDRERCHEISTEKWIQDNKGFKAWEEFYLDENHSIMEDKIEILDITREFCESLDSTKLENRVTSWKKDIKCMWRKS